MNGVHIKNIGIYGWLLRNYQLSVSLEQIDRADTQVKLLWN
jgi:hypothetical protein